MNSKASGRVYEDFEPTFNWVHGDESDTLFLLLSGFRREEMKVELSSANTLRVSGEQKMEDKRTVRRFYKEFSVPRDTNTDQIGAKFELDGKLYIKLPKVITKPPTQEEGPSKAEGEKVSEEKKKKKKDEKKEEKKEEEEAINNVGMLEKHKKLVYKLILFIMVAILMVLVIGIRVRNNKATQYSSSLGRSEIQEL